MSRRCVAFSAAVAVAVLMLGPVPPASAVIDNFGVDISSLSDTPTTPIYTSTPFYGGETNGNQNTTTYSVRIEALNDSLIFPILTSGLGPAIAAAELFVDGRLYEGGDSFTVYLMDSTTGWSSVGVLANSPSTDVPLEGGPPLTGRGSQLSNTDNVFLGLGPAFYDGLLNGTLQVKIVKTASNGNLDDFINGVNLQVSSVPEPTSILFFGTVLAGLGWAARKRFAREPR